MIPIVFLYLLRYVLTSEIEWTPNDILEKVAAEPSIYDPKNLDCYLIEPDAIYLNISEVNELHDMMGLIKDKYNYSTILTIIKQRSMEFTAEQFVKNLTRQMSSNFLFDISNTMSIFFSLGDHNYSVVMGDNVLKNFSSSDFTNYTNLIKNDLRQNNFGEAFIKLLGFIKDKNFNEDIDDDDDDDNGGSNGDADPIIVVIAVVVIVVVIIVGLLVKKKSGKNGDDNNTGDKEMQLNVGANGTW